MNRTQQKARQRQQRKVRKVHKQALARHRHRIDEATAPPAVGQVAHNPALHEATKPLAPELEAAIFQALEAGPALVFVIQHDKKGTANHCYRFNSVGWPHDDDEKAKGLVLGEFAKMRGTPAIRPAQAASTSGW